MSTINVKGIKLLYNQVITTADEYEEDLKSGTIIDTKHTKGTLKEYQKVVAVGPMVRDIKEGDLVMINPKRYAVKEHKEGSLKDGVIGYNQVLRYDFPMIEINHTNHLFLHDQDIDFVITDFEEEEQTTETNTSNLIVPDNKIIL